MIVEIDVGNTFLKWRLLDDRKVLCCGRQLTASIEAGLPAEWTAAVTEVRIASVAGSEVERRLTEYCARELGLVARIARTAAAAAGVTNSYSDPSRMGVDRWLAMLAAYHHAGSACCVVDCGSAITVDYVAADGCHQGGYIIPGLRLLQQALLSNTAEVIVDRNIARFSVEPGTDTSAAVSHGVNYIFQALQQRIVSELAQYKEPVALYITGGDGELFYQLAGEGELCPDLVMDGLVLSLE
ncbi:type III pantothenate kinase [Marinobacterium jannaschii]|uniref:type III pantothenate kinase n=1 Tax=Marinobacterium jannaschii TaxID=64970 RepID=UPI00047F8E0D|nr:type III pantothenate kinase [Marinobacterium jannaschii]